MPILGCLCSSISIRAPRMGSDVNPSTPVVTMGIFQSTPPAWEATIQLFRYQPGLYISIHAPAWGATAEINNRPCAKVFQSTPPHGERRMALCREKGRVHFNPRPRMGSDPACPWSMAVLRAFQSTLPHGERQVSIIDGASSGLFQSTLPHGERLDFPLFVFKVHTISIHAPAWGATAKT